MKSSLTKKQKIILSTIADLRSKLGKSPTLDEIRKALNYAGISSVQRHVDALKKKKYLSNEPYQARSFEISLPATTINIPLIGNIAGGQPLLAIENTEAYIPYEKSKVRGSEQDYFFLRVVGDSMNATNINGKTIDDGDYVLVKKQAIADFGSRIVALIGDEATVKKLSQVDGLVSLEPESTNSNNKPIRLLSENLLIQGIVKDVIKGGEKHNG